MRPHRCSALRAPVLLLGALLAAVPGRALAQEPEVPGCEGRRLESRVVTIRFKPVSEAALLVEQLLSPCGAYRLPKSLKVITVTDEPAPLRRVVQAISEWDVPPRPVEVSISLILATRDPAPKPGIAGELRDVSEQLAQLTRFTRFERIGTATVRALEGGSAEAEIGERYRVVFRIEAVDADRGIVRVEPFELYQRPAPNEAGASAGAPRRLLGMTVNLPEGRMNLVGAPARGNERALFLALTAWTSEGGATAGAEPQAGAAGGR